MSDYYFTERVRLTLAAAREEAARLRHEYVGTEHLLLALLGDPSSVAMAALTNLGVDPQRLAAMVEQIVKPGAAPSGQTEPELPYTSRAKKVLECTLAAGHDLHHSYVGPEHLLIGLLAEGQGIAAQLLADQGLTTERATEEIVRLLGPAAPHAEEAPATSAQPPHVEPTPQQLAAEQRAWSRLHHALEITRLLGATPTLRREADGTLVASLGDALEITIPLPPELTVRERGA